MSSIKQLLLLLLILNFSFLKSQNNADDFSDQNANEIEVITLSGVVTDLASGNPISGANVTVDDTDLGAATDADGTFSIEGVNIGSSVTVSVIGYQNETLFADTENLDFSLKSDVIEMSALEVLASRAGDVTPVSYTDVSKSELELRLASRDIPLAMNTIPSVYATGNGGGSGDGRINVRGFNQRNVGIMINGIPVNDMENGWVYWSNWDGIADATSSIQMQKGLSMVNLATPSIGGTMNIITDPSEQDRRGLFKQEVGAWGFLKTTISAHSGLMLDDKLALSATLVRKTGDGYVNGTWTDATAYYVGASYNLSDKHRFEFYAMGAPQRHGENRYKQNIAAYDLDFAKDLGSYDEDALYENDGEFVEAGRDFNQNVAPISQASQDILDASSGQYFEMYSVFDGVDRHESGSLSQIENFFHKPLASLNHFWTINEDMRLSSSLYYSGGRGGGTGSWGDIARKDANGVSDLRVEKHKFYYGPSPWTWDFDGTIAANASSASNVVIFQGDTVQRGDKESIGILRNSNNRQYTLGGITKFNFDVNDNLKTQFGVDYRYARIYHVKTIRDLLGGNYFVNTDSEFDSPNQQKVLGDPIDYNFTNFVNWLGFFGQAEYSTGDITAYGMGGMTSVKYSHWNHFKKFSNYSFSNSSAKDGSDADWVEGLDDSRGGNDDELFIEADAITTGQVKGGLMYDLGDKLSFLSSIPVFGKVYDNSNVWFNAGVVNKTPIMDQVIYEDDGDVFYTPNPKNEKFTSFELGLNTSSNDGTMAANFSIYSTTWSDRIEIRTLNNLDADDNVAHITGIEQVHSGIEAELAWQFMELARIDIGASLGKWIYNDNANGSYIDDGSDVEYGYALKDIRVGDMPQSMLLLGLTANPIEGSAIRFQYRYYDKHFSNWELSSREYDPSSTSGDVNLSFPQQVWQAPSYGVLDIHASYDIPFELGPAKPKLYVNIINALDATFIQDAVDNSKYNSFGNLSSTADDAEVYFGLPTSFNMGLSINF
jgi:hypothetical protein